MATTSPNNWICASRRCICSERIDRWVTAVCSCIPARWQAASMPPWSDPDGYLERASAAPPAARGRSLQHSFHDTVEGGWKRGRLVRIGGRGRLTRGGHRVARNAAMAGAGGRGSSDAHRIAE